MFTKHPWIKVNTYWQFLPLKLQNWQNKSLGILKWKLSHITLVLFMNDNLEQFDKLLGNYTFSPSKSKNDILGPLSFKMK